MIRPDKNLDMGQDALLRGARLEGARDRRWRGENAPPVARRLAQIGVLGWMIVIPMLVGVFAGRWLDNRFHTGVFYTAPLLLLGAVTGCWWAWRWMQKA
jgi:ATP synthase protein I